MNTPSSMDNPSTLPHRIGRISGVLNAGFIAVAAMLILWSVLRADALNKREDNPRTVETALRTERGTIFDAQGRVLAQTHIGINGYANRQYPISQTGSAVGYYTFRHGADGMEAGADVILQGSNPPLGSALWAKTLNLPQKGLSIRLTIDQELQVAASKLMAGHKGALILFSLPEAAVRAMVSAPSYDPNTLEDNFEALTADEASPLLNRATQGSYQPGMVIAPLIAASALADGKIALDDQLTDVTTRIMLDGGEIKCSDGAATGQDWVTALQNSCPAPMAALGEKVSAETLSRIFTDFGLTSAPPFSLTVAVPETAPIADARLAAIGQEGLTVTPLQVALAWAALADGGQLPQPQLLKAVEHFDDSWQTTLSAEPIIQSRAVSQSAADAIFEALRLPNGQMEYVAIALSGPEGGTAAWYVGVSGRYLWVIVLEDEGDVAVVRGLGRAVSDHLASN